jgi:hypothetical protein
VVTLGPHVGKCTLAIRILPQQLLDPFLKCAPWLAPPPCLALPDLPGPSPLLREHRPHAGLYRLHQHAFRPDLPRRRRAGTVSARVPMHCGTG